MQLTHTDFQPPVRCQPRGHRPALSGQKRTGRRGLETRPQGTLVALSPKSESSGEGSAAGWMRRVGHRPGWRPLQRRPCAHDHRLPLAGPAPEMSSPSSGWPPPSAVGGRGPHRAHRPLPPVCPDTGSREPAAAPWLCPAAFSRKHTDRQDMGVSVSRTAGHHLISRLRLDSILTHLLGTSCVPGPGRGRGACISLSPGREPRLGPSPAHIWCPGP